MSMPGRLFSVLMVAMASAPAATAEEGAKETAAEVKEAAGEVAKAAEGKKDEK